MATAAMGALDTWSEGESIQSMHELKQAIPDADVLLALEPEELGAEP